jgi:hypothetical protein
VTKKVVGVCAFFAPLSRPARQRLHGGQQLSDVGALLLPGLPERIGERCELA